MRLFAKRPPPPPTDPSPDRELLLAIIARHSGLRSRPLCVLSSAADIEAIEDGVLFVMAAWSLSAITAFMSRTAWLERLGCPVPAYVIDTDLVATGACHPEIKVIGHHGSGETFWFRDGAIIGSHLSPQPDEAEELARHLKIVIGE